MPKGTASKPWIAALGFISATPPAAILLDIQMPDLNGQDVIRQIHAASKPAGIPIIALRALAMVGATRNESCRPAPTST